MTQPKYNPARTNVIRDFPNRPNRPNRPMPAPARRVEPPPTLSGLALAWNRGTNWVDYTLVFEQGSCEPLKEQVPVLLNHDQGLCVGQAKLRATPDGFVADISLVGPLEEPIIRAAEAGAAFLSCGYTLPWARALKDRPIEPWGELPRAKRYRSGDGVRIAEVSIVETPALAACSVTHVRGRKVERRMEQADIGRIVEQVLRGDGLDPAAATQRAEQRRQADEAKLQADAAEVAWRIRNLEARAKDLRTLMNREFADAKAGKRGASIENALQHGLNASVLEAKAERLRTIPAEAHS